MEPLEGPHHRRFDPRSLGLPTSTLARSTKSPHISRLHTPSSQKRLSPALTDEVVHRFIKERDRLFTIIGAFVLPTRDELWLKLASRHAQKLQECGLAVAAVIEEIETATWDFNEAERRGEKPSSKKFSRQVLARLVPRLLHHLDTSYEINSTIIEEIGDLKQLHPEATVTIGDVPVDQPTLAEMARLRKKNLTDSYNFLVMAAQSICPEAFIAKQAPLHINTLVRGFLTRITASVETSERDAYVTVAPDQANFILNNISSLILHCIERASVKTTDTILQSETFWSLPAENFKRSSLWQQFLEAADAPLDLNIKVDRPTDIVITHPILDVLRPAIKDELAVLSEKLAMIKEYAAKTGVIISYSTSAEALDAGKIAVQVRFQPTAAIELRQQELPENPGLDAFYERLPISGRSVLPDAILFNYSTNPIDPNAKKLQLVLPMESFENRYTRQTIAACISKLRDALPHYPSLNAAHIKFDGDLSSEEKVQALMHGSNFYIHLIGDELSSTPSITANTFRNFLYPVLPWHLPARASDGEEQRNSVALDTFARSQSALNVDGQTLLFDSGLWNAILHVRARSRLNYLELGPITSGRARDAAFELLEATANAIEHLEGVSGFESTMVIISPTKPRTRFGNEVTHCVHFKDREGNCVRGFFNGAGAMTLRSHMTTSIVVATGLIVKALSRLREDNRASFHKVSNALRRANINVPELLVLDLVDGLPTSRLSAKGYRDYVKSTTEFFFQDCLTGAEFTQRALHVTYMGQRATP